MAKKTKARVAELKRRHKKRAADACPSEVMLEASPDWSMLAEEELEAADGDKPKVPTFKMTAYTGGRMRPRYFYRDVVVDVAGVSVPRSRIPILRSHDPDRIVGDAKVTVGDNRITAEGNISGVGIDADEVVATARNGFPWQASIGAKTEKMQYLEANETAVVNGRTVRGPVYIARKLSLREISFVAAGADPRTHARVNVAADALGASDMTFEQWLHDKFGLEASGLDDAVRGNYEAIYQAELAAADPTPTPPADPPADPPAATATDNVSIEDIIATANQAVAGNQLRINRITQLANGEYPDLVASAVGENWSVEKFELELTKKQLETLRAGRVQASGPSIHDGTIGRDDAVNIECAMAMSSGYMTAEQAGNQYSEQTVDRAVQADMRGFGLHRLMHVVLQAAGMSHPVGQNDNEFIRKAFRASEMLQASAFSTMSLPGILSNVANKTLLASYQMYESVIPFFCAVTSSPDFKPFFSYRIEGDGVLKKVGKDGTIAHMSLAETEFSNRVEQYARMLAVDRIALINDDLGAFTQNASRLGEASFKAHELAGITMLLNPPDVDGTPFFDAAHGNLSAGAESVLSIDGLTEADTLFGLQTGADGLPISVNAERLLVPRSLKVTASQLMTETMVNETTAEGKPEPANNPHAGAYEYRSTPWLENATIPNSSALSWYLFANPAVLAAFQVAYLRGAQSPTIESSDVDFNQLGVQMRAYFDFGFGPQDPKGAVKSAGQ